MMGDNRGESDDSRFWGPVPTAWIIGEAFSPTGPPTASAPLRTAWRAARWRPPAAAAGRRAPGARAGRGGRRAAAPAALFAFDRRLGVRLVAGADEAGRGCLAGPLVAAAVLFDYERARRPASCAR